MKSRSVVPDGHSEVTFPKSLSLFSLGQSHICAMFAQNVQHLTCPNLAEFSLLAYFMQDLLPFSPTHPLEGHSLKVHVNASIVLAIELKFYRHTDFGYHYTQCPLTCQFCHSISLILLDMIKCDSFLKITFPNPEESTIPNYAFILINQEFLS